jgi:type I restriction enzyme M protein
LATLTRISESRAEAAARELLALRGWNTAHPPRGHLLWKNEYRDYPHLNEALAYASKSGPGDGLPDFIILSRQTQVPLIIGETKANIRDIDLASNEASKIYGEAFIQRGINVLAAGVAGDGDNSIAVRVSKRSKSGWRSIEYRQQPIEWIPTPEETDLLLHDDLLFHLDPHVPPPDVLAAKADEINRILRESRIKDEFRPAVIGAIMLALWKSRGDIRTSAEYILQDINKACQKAFEDAGKYEIAESILVPEANERLAANAARISRILRLLNVTTLTAAHDYLGQLYETFFRFTGGNTIGQFFTPRHITKFIADLCEITESDYVVDPTCGTGGFLISALYRMIGNRNLTRDQVSRLVANHLSGFESEPITAALCVTNMILRGDGTTGIIKGDCFTDDRFGSITRFLQRERPLSALGSLPVKLEDTLKSPVVFGAPQRHHQVDSLH